MKRKLLFLFVLACFNVVQAQQSVTITGPSTVEVGQSYNYTAKFNPVYPSNSYGDQADAFVITLFSIQTGTNGNTGTVSGSINNIANTSYWSDGTFNSPGERTIPIKWGSGALSSDTVLAKFSGYYMISNTGEIVSYFNFVQEDKSVSVQLLHTPVSVTGPATIQDCSQSNVNFSLSNASSVNGNQYQWTATNGTIVGSSAGTSVTIKPNLTGPVTAKCTVRRSGSVAAYFVSGQKTVQRTPFTSSATITGNNTICTSRTYTITGLQTGETVTWSLSNSTSVSMSSTTGTSTTLTKTGGGSVTLIATILNSCGTQTVTKSMMLYAGSPPFVHWELGLQEQHSCDTKFHYVPIKFTIPVGVSLSFLYIDPSVSYTSQNVGFEEYLYIFQFPKNYSGYFDFFAKYTNSCGSTILDLYQEIEIRSCAEMGLSSSAFETTKNENNFTVYPNPANDYVNISLISDRKELLSNDEISAELFDIVGVKKASVKIIDFTGKINVENLTKGIYILKINSADQSESHQIIIE